MMATKESLKTVQEQGHRFGVEFGRLRKTAAEEIQQCLKQEVCLLLTDWTQSLLGAVNAELITH